MNDLMFQKMIYLLRVQSGFLRFIYNNLDPPDFDWQTITTLMRNCPNTPFIQLISLLLKVPYMNSMKMFNMSVVCTGSALTANSRTTLSLPRIHFGEKRTGHF